MESFSEITEERDEAILRAEQWKNQVEQQKEDSVLLQDMEKDVLAFSEELGVTVSSNRGTQQFATNCKQRETN